MWYTHTQEYYSAVKKNETLPFATTWIDLASIMLSKIRQSGKVNTIWFHSYVESKKQSKQTKGKKETNQETDS